MKLKHAMLVSISAALLAASPVLMAGGSVTKKSELTWKDMGNGIAAAPVSGDMAKGASRFFLKYPAGLVTPNHHHNADLILVDIPSVSRQGARLLDHATWRRGCFSASVDPACSLPHPVWRAEFWTSPKQGSATSPS